MEWDTEERDKGVRYGSDEEDILHRRDRRGGRK
jgi:hypothetical protein